MRQQDFLRLSYHNFRPFSSVLCEHGDGFLSRLILCNIDIDFEKVDEASHYIPCGRNTWDGRYERFDLTELRCYIHLKDTKRLERSLGTLGGGNHFIEVDVDENGGKYLVIHSGSRNLGTQVAEFYQQLAVDLNVGKEEYFKKREEIIRTYKEQGRRTEIQATCVVPDTLDESPMAYKSMDEIIDNIEPTAEIICKIKPIYNFKAAE